MAVRVVDYSPLTAPVSSAEVSAWRAQAKASGARWASVNVNTVVAVVVGCLIAVVSFNIIVGAIVSVVNRAGANPGGAIVPLLIFGGLLAGVAVVVRKTLKGGGRWARWLRIARFAQANGMSFTPAQGNPGYPGQIFQLGRNRTSLDHLVTTSGRFLDMGNYRWVTGSGKSQTTHTWGFLALSLDRNMPNIVLDSRANNSIFGTNLPSTLNKSQVLHLEGDFDKYFTLYCPAQYEQDALYIFTPDLMALLIDEAAPFDVELVDDWMFVYSSHAFDMTDPAVYRRLFTIADTVGTKTLSQTDHYADARVGDFDANVVAPQGARLKRGVSVTAIVVFAAFAVFWAWNFFSSMIVSLLAR